MYKFKKIASATASAVMMFSTVALAAAANYPAPFVSGGSADVAVIYGSAPTASVDLLAVLDVQQSLNDYVVSGGGSEGGGENIEGEAYPLFTSSTRIYLNDTLNKARTSVSSNDMPIALKDGSFQGDVTATYTQKVDLGTTSGVNNRFAFGQHPTSDDDPVYAFDLGSKEGRQFITYLYLSIKLLTLVILIQREKLSTYLVRIGLLEQKRMVRQT